MKTYKHLFEKIVSFDNLLLAAKKAQKGKRFKTSTARFNFHLEKELLGIQEELMTKTYKPGKYTAFYIYEPKERLISAAPYRDRVVHHALCNVIEPIFDRTFIYDSYANRIAKGTHKAVKRFTKFCRINNYVLKCDIKKYFPSIDHKILFDMIRKKIKDSHTLWLIKLVIVCSNEQEKVMDYFPGDNLFSPIKRRKGLPIGNLTSQFFANIYLNGTDHFIKEDLRCNYYIRYVDDFVILDDNKRKLQGIKREISSYLEGLRLKLHHTKSRVFPTRLGTDFLGYRIYPTHRLLRNENGWRFIRRLRKLREGYLKGEISLEKVNQSVQSWVTHASYADTYGLRRKIFSEISFVRG